MSRSAVLIAAIAYPPIGMAAIPGVLSVDWVLLISVAKRLLRSESIMKIAVPPLSRHPASSQMPERYADTPTSESRNRKLTP